MADEFEKMGESLKAKTGKGLDEWVATARAAGIAGHMALVNHLKTEHGLGHGYANMIVHAANASSSLSQDDDTLVGGIRGSEGALAPALRPAGRVGAGVRRRCRTVA